MGSPSTSSSPERRNGSIWTVPGMRTLAILTMFGFTGYAALLPVAPMWVVEGGAGTSGAGLVNGVMLGATVATQGFIPMLLRRLGWRTVLILGMVLMGVPSLATAFSSELWWVLACSVVRGMGFGVLTVCGSAAVAELVEPWRRGAGIGAYGLAVAVPNVLALSLSPWLAETVGFWAVFVVGAAPLLAVPVAARLAADIVAAQRSQSIAEHPASGVGPEAVASATAGFARPPDEPDDTPADDTPADDYDRRPQSPVGSSAVNNGAAFWIGLLVPTLILLSVTLAGGGVMTFLPQMVPSAGLVLAGLLMFTAVAALSRWAVGSLADRHGPTPFVAPLLLASVVGLGLISWSVAGLAADPASGGGVWAATGSLKSEGALVITALLVGAGVLGTGYGALQNLTLVLAFHRVPRRRIGTASAVWNVGFDAGTAGGSIIVGALAAGMAFADTMLVLAVFCAAAVPLAFLTRRRESGADRRRATR